MLAAIGEAAQQLEFADAESVRLGADGGVDTSALRHSIELASNRLSRARLFHQVLSGEVEPGISPVSVAYLFDDIVVATRAILGNSAIKISSDMAGPDIWPLDRELILEVCYNALLSAATHARSQVSLRATLEDAMLVLSIEDDGPGFPALDEDSFHERGFGLYVAQKIASLHHRGERYGQVSVSNCGSLGGAVFALHLP